MTYNRHITHHYLETTPATVATTSGPVDCIYEVGPEDLQDSEKPTEFDDITATVEEPGKDVTFTPDEPRDVTSVVVEVSEPTDVTVTVTDENGEETTVTVTVNPEDGPTTIDVPVGGATKVTVTLPEDSPADLTNVVLNACEGNISGCSRSRCFLMHHP